MHAGENAGLEARRTPPQFGLGARTGYERSATIDAIFSARARERPGAIAAAGPGFALTYGELERDSNRIANALRARGVRPGASAGVALERSPHLPAALLGILKAGAAYVPLDPSYPRSRLVAMVEDAAVELVLGERDAGSFAGTAATCVGIDAARAAPDERPDPAPDGARSLAYVMYTSGSTGRPKGVAIEHRGVVRLVRNTDYVDIAPDDVTLHHAPLGFDASTFEIWGALLNGARLVLPPPGLHAPDELAATIERHGVTTLWISAALFARFVDAEPHLPSLRFVITGGDVLSVAHARRFLERFPECRLVNAYGPTENTTFSTTHPVSRDDAQRASVPIGRPIANSSAYVLDEDFEPVEVGESGELWVGGDGIAREYLKQPERTAERFVADPFSTDRSARLYRTGDRVRLCEGGVLEFLGRSDDQVKVRGFRIEPGEIEAALRLHRGVHEAFVVVVERDGEKEIVAHVVPWAGHRIDEPALRAHLKDTLPSFALPHRIVIRTELPLGSHGKVDRSALVRESLQTRGGGVLAVARAGVEFPPARANGEREPFDAKRALAEIWCEVLVREHPPGLDENFFDAGGDSLRVLSVRKLLAERLGIRVRIVDLFEHTTLRKLAAFLNEAPA